MTIFVIGKNGLIAKNALKCLANSGFDVKCTSFRDNDGDLFLDLGAPVEFDYSVIEEGDLVLCPAGISSPDICLSDHGLVYRINVAGTKYFISQCLDRGANVIFFSSDLVYGESLGDSCFDEKTECNPIAEYARMKSAVEESFLENPNFKVLRMSYVFSKDDKFMAYLQKCSDTGETAEVYHPIYRNVVYIGDVMDALVAFAKNFLVCDSGVLNVCGEDLISRKDMTEIYKSIAGNGLSFKVVEPDEEFFLARPKRLCTKSLYFSNIIGHSPVSIKEAMVLEFNT
jgi:dTDP-4-dehydrorhamnose reductase